VSHVKEWTAVVTDPLGLAGFALFLVFSVLGLRRRATEVRWVTASFIALAAVGLLGGLGLAYMRQGRQADPHAAGPVGSAPVLVTQETHGSQSPAVSNVQGNVTIIQGAAPGKYAPAEPPPNITGTWVSGTLTNPYQKSDRYTLMFELVLQGDGVLGSVTETAVDRSYRVPRAIVNGKIQDNVVSFQTESGLLGEETRYKQIYTGTVEKGEIRFTRQNNLPTGGEIERFTAKRKPN
jgi:hypothetical protein